MGAKNEEPLDPTRKRFTCHGVVDVQMGSSQQRLDPCAPWPMDVSEGQIPHDRRSTVFQQNGQDGSITGLTIPVSAAPKHVGSVIEEVWEPSNEVSR